MLTHEHHAALSHLRSQTWQRTSHTTWLSEEERLKNLCKTLADGPPHLLIPSLAATLINFPPQYRSILQNLITSLLARVTDDKWSFIDQEIRSEIYSLQYQFRQFRVEETNHDLKNPLDQLFALSHPNGYLRERAITSLQPPFSSSVIAILILRFNDWVTPVQHAAQAKIIEIQANHLIKFTGEILTSLLFLKRSSRYQASHIESHIDSSILGSREGLEAVIDVLQSSKTHLKRKAASQFLLRHHRRLEPSDINVFFTHGSPRELSMLLQAARQFSEIEQRAILDRVRDSKLVPLRRERLRLLGELDDEKNEPEFIAALSDLSKSVRTIARFHLKNWSQEKFANHYLALLSTQLGNQKFRGTMLGLSEVNPQTAHTTAMKSLAKDLTISRQKTCIECLDFHSPDLSDCELTAWLSSPDLSISRACYRRLIEQRRLLPAQRLTEIASDLSQRDHSRQVAWLLLEKSQKWQALPSLFELAVNPNHEISNRAEESLNRWLLAYGRSFTVPSKIEREALQKSFARYREQPDCGLANSFENLLKF